MKRTFYLSLLAFAASISSFAQEKQQYTNFNDTTFNINEVVITSRYKEPLEVLKLNVPLRHIPVSTNAISSKMLENRGLQNLNEVGRFLPGISIKTNYGAFQQIKMRGFNHAVIMVDGVRDERSAIENSYLFMDLSSVESIEYIKGPASALFGHSTIGGVINIKRKKPSRKPTLNATLSYGSYDRRRVTLNGSAPLSKRTFLSSSLNYSGGEGWRKTNNQRLSGYLALQSRLSDRGTLEVRAAGNHDFYGTEIGFPGLMPGDIYKVSDNTLHLKDGASIPGIPRQARFNNESDFCYNRAWNISARYVHQFDNNTRLSNKLSYSYDDIDYFGTERLGYMTSDDPIYDYYYMRGKKKTYIGLDSVQLTFPLRFSHIAKTINNQLDLIGELNLLGMKHHYNIGYTLVSVSRTTYSGYNLGVDVKGPGLFSKVSVFNPQSAGPMTTTFGKYTLNKYSTHGLFLNDLIELNDQFKLQLSGRMSLYDYARTNGKANNGKREHDKPEKSQFKRVTTKAFTYKTGLVYSPCESFSGYVSLSSFFQPYRITYDENTTYINAQGKEFLPIDGKEIFKPRTGGQIEIGGKISLNDKISLNASAYYIKMKNIVSTLAYKGDEVVINGETIVLDKKVSGQVNNYESKGFDFDISYAPTSNLSFKAGYSYTRPRNLKMSSNDYITNSEDSKVLPTYTPVHNFYTYGAYVIRKGFLKNLGFNMDLTYNDKMFMDFQNTRTLPSYWMLDAGASYRFLNNKMLVAFNLYNILNQDYIEQNLGYQLTPAMPRNFRVSLKYTL